MKRILYKIDPKYDVILTYSPIIEITGHLFECFDYYLFLREYYKVGILLFNGMKRSALCTAFESKYNISFDDIESDLLFLDNVSRNSIVDIYVSSKTFLLITDGNIKASVYNGINFIAKQIFGFLCEPDPGYIAGIPNNIVYLQDYRIYGKNTIHQSINYVKKLPFKYYKRCRDVNKKIGMMYMTYICRKVSADVVVDYFKKSHCDNAILITPYKSDEYNNLPNITQVIAPVDNLFDKFGTYIYLPVKRQFDCSPRLVTECYMHNKNVFMQLDYSDPGLEIRKKDAETDLNILNLKDGDDIINIIDNFLQR
jgi:hypothetical protein